MVNWIWNKTKAIIKGSYTKGTWNVRTLQQYGKIIDKERELRKYKWHILGYQKSDG